VPLGTVHVPEVRAEAPGALGVGAARGVVPAPERGRVLVLAPLTLAVLGEYPPDRPVARLLPAPAGIGSASGPGVGRRTPGDLRACTAVHPPRRRVLPIVRPFLSARRR
jgi:hypothetical protein